MKSLRGKVVSINFWTYRKSMVEDRTFEVEFLDPGVQALDFTFG